MSNLGQFSYAGFKEAMAGNARCIQEIFLRLDGPITQPVAQETVLRVEYASDYPTPTLTERTK